MSRIGTMTRIDFACSARMGADAPGDSVFSGIGLRPRLAHVLALLTALVLGTSPLSAAPKHGIAMIGEPALAPGFTHLPYANPDAPSGGRVVYGETGGFDSLNPHIVKGRYAWGMRVHVFESLMARSRDEPFTLYGLLAETIETPEDRSWVEFHLRPEARFSDGDPVTVDDVIFSLETLRDKGRPSHGRYYGPVVQIDRVGERGVRFTFDEPHQERPLLIGLMPILKRSDWEGKMFDESTLVPPIASGPYVVESFEANRTITFGRNPDYWGRDLLVNRGINNFDEIRYDYFQDSSARFEAFKAGEVRLYRETDPVQWEEGYNFPAARDGRVVLGEIEHGRPSGMSGLVMNARRSPFDDLRVRRALEAAFDFEWINKTLNRNAYERIVSYFGNSELGHSGTATGREKELLMPFADELPAGTLEEGWRPTTGDGSGRDRQRLRTARDLLAEAGWNVEDGKLLNASGDQLTFEILVRRAGDERIAEIFSQAVVPLGIEASVRLVDSSQYQERLNTYDYDAIIHSWWASLSPGAEQGFYWGSEGVMNEGTRNYMGVNSPAIDAMVKALTSAKTKEEFVGAARAIDRVLSAGVYVIPFWFAPTDRFAWWIEQRKPERASIYGFRPEVWWSDPETRP